MMTQLLLALALSAVSGSQPASNAASPKASAQRTENGEYVTPLQQQTQPTYVPQSVALSGPAMIKNYEEGDAIPEGYTKQYRIRKGMVAGGAVTFGAVYIATVLAGAVSVDFARAFGGPGAPFLFVPVFGPLVEMGLSARGSVVGQTFLFFDFLAQAAGVTLFAVGLAVPKAVLVRNDLVKATIEPILTGTGGGVKVTW
jgi:hypothetical protein